MIRSALCVLLSSAAFAQSIGSIAGKVVDDFGEPVGGASVVVTNGAKQEFKATSSATGEYRLDKLPVGSYDVTVTALQMQPYGQKGVAVDAARPLGLDVALRPTPTLLGTLGDGDRFSAAFNATRRKASPAGPTPLMPDGKPDLSGFWSAGAGPQSEPPQPRPWADAIRKEREASNGRDNPTARCLPGGVILNAGNGKFVQTPVLLLIMGGTVRQIFLDGRPHPKDPNPTWFGHSIGHWEGDTLVVDTIGFNGLAWYSQGMPSTEGLHVIERYRRPGLGHLELEMTVEDPAVLQRSWTTRRVSNLDPNGDLEESVCENEKDYQHMVGK
jgi:hypothetical protein